MKKSSITEPSPDFFGVGIGISITANAALGGATYLTNCAINGNKANIVDLGFATGIGALSGIIGGPGADGANLRGVVKTSKQVLKTAVSPKKVAMYSAKISTVKKTVVISAIRTVAAGFISNRLNHYRKVFTKSDS